MNDLVAAYHQSSDEDDDLPNNTNDNVTNDNATVSNSNNALILAPDIDTSTSGTIAQYPNIDTKEILHNPPADVLFGQIQGPLRKYSTSRNDEFKPKLTTLAGYAEVQEVDDLTFNEQYHTYSSFGYAINPNDNNNDNDNDINNKYIGNLDKLKDNKAMTIYNQSNKMAKIKKKNRKKRLRNDDPSDIDGYLGPWAKIYKTEKEKLKYLKDANKRKNEWKLTEELRENKRKKRRLNNNNNEPEEEDEETRRARRIEERKHSQSIENSVFNGNDMYDYQGRTYMHCPSEYRSRSSNKYYIPKKKIYQYNGHKDGINAIKFIPKTGHLLLSASNDNTCKLWDVYNNKSLLRTYSGHTAGIRNICFNNNGTRFLTTSYDKWIKLWDTETGKVIFRGTSGILPFNAKFYPKNENEFLCGQKNKLAIQWDIRNNKIIQKYDEHLSAVNDVLFIDNNKRFVTTSDDKKIFIWDYGTPVVIKHISEPTLHSVPYLKLHSNKKWFLGQSMDNKIICYSAQNKIGRLNSKKTFTGHLSSGYACSVDCSYDGNIILSGDSSGKIYFWDWKTTKLYQKIQCHKKVTMEAIFHPVQTSLVATCSWDGTICLWD